MLESASFACQADVGELPWSKVFMRSFSDLPIIKFSRHPDFRIFALGHVVRVEGLRKLKAHGAKTIEFILTLMVSERRLPIIRVARVPRISFFLGLSDNILLRDLIFSP
jgi:hypothetical protein